MDRPNERAPSERSRHGDEEDPGRTGPAPHAHDSGPVGRVGRSPAGGNSGGAYADDPRWAQPQPPADRKCRYILRGIGNEAGTIIQLFEGVNTCGRGRKGVQVRLDGDTVSRLHAELEVRGNEIVVRDLDAHNGTFVNGKRIKTCLVAPGDEIGFGATILRLSCDKGTTSAGSRSAAKLETGGRSLDSLGRPRYPDESAFAAAKLSWSTGSYDDEPSPADLSLSFGLDGRRRLWQALAELGRFLVNDHSEENVHQNCLAAVARLFNYRRACLLVLNGGGETRIQSVLPDDTEDPELHVSQTLIAEVFRTRKAVLSSNSQELTDTARRKGIRSALVAPLLENDDVIGAIYLDQGNSLRPFESRHLERLEVVANLVSAKIKQAQTRNEMELAGYIQTRLLPSKPQAPLGYETAFRLEPFHLVGGDFYETRELPDGRYLIAFGDVVGNGVPAALIMSNVLAAIRALAPSTATPLELVERVTDLAREQLRPTEFVTLFIGFLDPITHRLRYCNAGHELPALFHSDGTVTRLQPTAPAVGHIRIPFQGDTVEIPPGSLLCIWSDGITEACRPGVQPQMFTEERLLGVLKRVHRSAPSDVAKAVFDRVDDFLCGTHARDDRAILLVRRNAGAQPM